MTQMVADDGGYLHEGGGPSIVQQREKMVQEGDFQGLWQELLDEKWSLIDQAECFRLLLQSVEVAARTNPRQLSADMFAKTISFCSYLLLRTHFQLGTLFARHDECMRSMGDLPVPREITEALPALMQLQEHLAVMLEAQARAARMWQLADKTRRGDIQSETIARSDPEPHGAIPFRSPSDSKSRVAEKA